MVEVTQSLRVCFGEAGGGDPQELGLLERLQLSQQVVGEALKSPPSLQKDRIQVRQRNLHNKIIFQQM